MTEKTKIVSNFSIDKVGAKKIGKSFLVTVIGAGVVALGDLFNVIDLGSWQPLLLTLAPFVINTIKVWSLKYESKE